VNRSAGESIVGGLNECSIEHFADQLPRTTVKLYEPQLLDRAEKALENVTPSKARYAGTRNTRPLRNAKGDPSGSPLQVSQESLVAGARNTRFLRLVECEIPKLAA